MDDILLCPICGNKLRTHNLDNKLLHHIGKTANYAERVCSRGHNHVLMIWVDKETKQIDFLKLSLNPKYSRFVEVDFVNQRCRISCLKDGQAEYIEIPKMLELDFPDLTKLKERVGMYIVFS